MQLWSFNYLKLEKNKVAYYATVLFCVILTSHLKNLLTSNLPFESQKTLTNIQSNNNLFELGKNIFNYFFTYLKLS